MKANCVIVHNGIRYNAGDELPFGNEVKKVESVQSVSEDSQYTKAEIQKLTTAALRELGESLGIVEKNVLSLRKKICDKLGL